VAPGSEQGSQFAAFVQDELAQEYSRRETVNSRAAVAITSSTGLVTVVLAVIAVVRGKDFTLKGWPLFTLVAALICLLGAAVLAVLAGMAWGVYKVASVADLRKLVGPLWTSTEVTARSTVAQARVEIIDTLRNGNNKKFRLLLASAWFQVGAIIFLAASAVIVVVRQS
jgi:Na+/melibiose symporter-like transporter